MTPLWIELEGIRSFTATRRIEFTDLGLFAILGDTGAGKSSILEAMVYALFNATTWDGVNVKELMSTGAARMRVQFSFILKGRTYTVSRSTPRDGAASHLLQCEGGPDERRDGATAVDRRIQELLGVDRETFIKTVILPQGQFAALLTLRPAERTKLLTDILGLNVVDDMVRALAGPRERATALAAGLRGQRSRLADNPSAAVANAEAENERASKACGLLETTLTEVRKHEGTLAAIEARVQARAGCKASLQKAEPAFEKLSNLIELNECLLLEAKAADEARSDAAVRLQTATGQLRRLADQRRDAETLGRASESLRQLTNERLERAREAAELQQRQGNLVSAHAELIEVAKRLESAQSARNAARKAFSLEQLRAKSEAAALMAAERAFSELATARTEVLEAERLARDAAAAVAKAVDAVTRAQSDLDQVNGALQAAEDALERARRKDAAAHAALGLSAGEPCPVCERPLPKGFREPAAPDLASCRSTERAASERARSAQEKLTRAETIHEQRVSASENAAKERDRCAKVLERRTKAAKNAGLDAEPSKAEAGLNSIRRRAGEVQEQAREADEASRSAETAFATCLATDKAAHAVYERAGYEVSARKASLMKRDGRIDAICNTIPERYRPKSEWNEAVIAELGAALAAEIEAAKSLVASRTQAALEQSAASDTLRKIEARRETELAAPQRDACAQFATVVETLTSLGFTLTAPRIEPGSAPLEEALIWAREVVEAAASSQQKLAHDDARDLEQSRRERKAVAEFIEQNGAISTSDLAATHLASVRSAAIAANVVASVRRAAEEAAELDTCIGAIEPLERALNALQFALGDAKFKHFVAGRKESDLLGVATTILGRMTDERYGFGKSFRIVDRTAGQERSAQTLSGGEKFLASLALALALVEIAARTGGRFGTLFLDEGFGALDQHALDSAFSELDRQAAGGRLIGVITHVREVTEYIDEVLTVVKGADGSDVRRMREEVGATPAEDGAFASIAAVAAGA